MADWYKHTVADPEDRDARIISDIDVSVILAEFPESIQIASIISKLAKGSGNGSRAMQVICDLADEHQVALELFASQMAKSGASNTRSLSTPELKKWYSKFGFQKSVGNNMKREPRTVEHDVRSDVNRRLVELAASSDDRRPERPVVNSPLDVTKLLWIGNSHDDRENFQAVDDYLINRCQSVIDACLALEVLSMYGCGEDEPCDEAGLREYLELSELTPKHFTV